MGVFIHIDISKSVKQEEWEKVYEETLQLIKYFPLAEKQKVKCRGIDTICLVPTEERKTSYGRHGEKTRVGWCTIGDYETMHTAEDYYLPRHLVEDDKVKPDAGDAMLGVLPSYLDYDWEDEKCTHVYRLWGNKTQGEPYHMYLLAIACTIESRLGEKAFVYGDITRGQCKKAVELASEYLKEPINIPARCDMERLWKRITKLPLTEREQLNVFKHTYLGTKDADFGEYIRSKYSGEICKEYWKQEFEKYYVGTYGFNEKISEYLLWGFDLEELCHMVNYYDKDNNPQYEKFVQRIMDAKLHQQEKNCEDILGMNQEEEAPYSIYTIMAQFVFAGAKNKKVARYIPIEELRKILKNVLGTKCDVDSIVDQYLAKEAELLVIKTSGDEVSDENMKALCEQDASEVFQQIMDNKRQSIVEDFNKYNICDYDNLIYYEQGDNIHPGITESLKQSYVFYNSILEEKYYKQLMTASATRRCAWLIEQNRSFLIRDKDWNRIFTDIEEHEESFSRYYPMMRVKTDSNEIIDMIQAIILNDDLYDYCKELVVFSEKEKTE